MTSGKPEDWVNTLEQLRDPDPVRNGKIWLRHLENKQSGVIDQMLLEGKSSIEEITEELNKRFKLKNMSFDRRMLRVKEHIENLQNGDWRGEISGMLPHKLKLKEVNGKWMFDLD